MGLAKKYGFSDVSLFIGSVSVQGYAEDATITFEQQGDTRTFKVGADGEVVVSPSSDRTLICTFSLLQTSVANRRLQELSDAQDQADIDRVAYTDVGFLMEDPIGGDVVQDRQCYFLQSPSPDMAQEAGSREWRILLPNGRDKSNMRLAANQTV